MRLGLILACLAALATIGVLVTRGGGSEMAPGVPPVSPSAHPLPQAPPALEPSAGRPVEAWGLRVAEAKAYLTGPSPEAKRRVLAQLIDGNVRAPELVEPLEALAGDPAADPLLRSMAMVALMRTRGTRKHVPFIADLAARNPYGKFEAVLVALLPTTGGLVTRATRWLQAVGSDDRRRAEIERILRLGIDDPDAAVAQVRVELQRPAGSTAEWAADVALGLRPVPAELSTALDRLLGEPDAAAATRVLRSIQEFTADFRESRGLVAATLVHALQTARPELRDPLVGALGSVGDAGPQTLDALLAAARSPDTIETALGALARLGPRATAGTPALVAMAARVPTSSRPVFHRALFALGSREAIPYVRDALKAASANESTELLDGLPSLEGAETLLPDIVRFTESPDGSLAARAAEAMTKIDGRLAHPETERCLRALLRSENAQAAQGALAALRHLQAITHPVVEASLPAMDSPQQVVRQEALRQIRTLGRIQPALPAVVERLLREVDRQQAPDARGALLEALGQMEPTSPRVRTKLREALQDANPLVLREGALRGFAYIDDPTAEEYVAVAAQCSAAGLYGFAMLVLKRPPWETVRARAGIQTTFSQR